MSDISLEQFNDKFGFLTFLGRAGVESDPPDQTLQSVVRGSSSTSLTQPVKPPHLPP